MRSVAIEYTRSSMKMLRFTFELACDHHAVPRGFALAVVDAAETAKTVLDGGVVDEQAAEG